MKKVLLLVAAFLVIFSSVAAVSAYEAHQVDIKVHVENAIGLVTDNDLDLDTMFPQETAELDLEWGMSKSFYMQDRLSEINYNLYFEIKDESHHSTGSPIPLYEGGYFQPLNPFMTVTTTNPNLTLEDAAAYRVKPTEASPIVMLGSGNLYWTNTGNNEVICAGVHVHIDIPVFEGYYNELTDAQFRPGSWGSLDPMWTPMLMVGEYELVDEAICDICTPVPHADLGINFKVQVTGFTNHVGEREVAVWPYQDCEPE